MKHYEKIMRNEWQQLQSQFAIQLDEQTLKQLQSVNDVVSMDDVVEIYGPLLSLFQIHYTTHQLKHEKRQQFLNQTYQKVPFIIGISGSVAVGKSTTARLLQTLLQQIFTKETVALMTTDGFLYDNATLAQKNLLDKKGFPDSYDMVRLTDFLRTVKTSQEAIDIPVYSHEIYDILPNTYQTINCPDILIVEGINVLQMPPNKSVYASDFFDWSIYVDANANDIEKWFLQRFELLLDKAKNDRENFYYVYANDERSKAIAMAKHVWQTINLKNLVEFILPTRNRADVILHKGQHHNIDYILLKKY